MITLYDYRGMFTDESQLVRIFDNGNEVVYEGAFDELPDELEDSEISSFDYMDKSSFDGYIGININ